MRIAVIGAQGQLGSELMAVFGSDAIPFDKDNIDIADASTLKVLEDCRPDVIINTAGYVKVAEAEGDFENCFRVNALGAMNVALMTKKLNAVNVYIGTDYVFDGIKKSPYTENDAANPLNVYGCSKLAGELFTKNYSGKYYIVRTSSLFGKGASGKRKNFIDSVISSAREHKPLELVDDIIMSPTYAKDLAFAIRQLLNLKPETGTYHICNSGQCTWFDFASRMLMALGMKTELRRTKSANYDKALRRPAFSALSNEKALKAGIKMRNWEQALEDFLKEYHGR